MKKPLTRSDRVAVFKLATRSLVRWHGDKFKDGMTDSELETALE